MALTLSCTVVVVAHLDAVPLALPLEKIPFPPLVPIDFSRYFSDPHFTLSHTVLVAGTLTTVPILLAQAPSLRRSLRVSLPTSTCSPISLMEILLDRFRYAWLVGVQ